MKKHENLNNVDNENKNKQKLKQNTHKEFRMVVYLISRCSNGFYVLTGAYHQCLVLINFFSPWLSYEGLFCYYNVIIPNRH